MNRHAKWRRVNPQAQPIVFLATGIALFGFAVLFVMTLISAWIALSG